MRRDAVDFSEVRAAHAEIHARLIEWARWVRPGRGGAAMSPMFRGYVPYLYPEVIASIPIDTLRALATERAVARVPRPHDDVLRWAYVFPYIPVHKVRRQIGLTDAGLFSMLDDARSMAMNISRRNTHCKLESVVVQSA